VSLHPRVSVIIPAYECESRIGSTLEHLRRQSYRDFEAVVVNDGSRDGTSAAVRRAVAADSRIRLVEQAEAGAIAFKTLLQPPPMGREDEFHGLKAGFRFLRHDRVLRTLLLAWVVFISGMGMSMVADAPLAAFFGAGSFGFGLLITLVGIPILIAMLYVSRGMGWFERGRANVRCPTGAGNVGDTTEREQRLGEGRSRGPLLVGKEERSVGTHRPAERELAGVGVGERRLGADRDGRIDGQDVRHLPRPWLRRAQRVPAGA